MRDLLAFLENGGISLDGDNQLHVTRLLAGAWGNYAGTTLEALRCTVRPEDNAEPVEVAVT